MSFPQVAPDAVRRFWNQRPCNLQHSSKAVGSREYFDEVEARRYFVEPHILPFAEFHRWRGKKVLEIGCGIGTDAIQFAKAGAWVTAVELSDRSLEITRRRAQVYGLEDQFRFFLGDAEELTRFVPMESYDLIYAFGVFHHTPHPERILEQIRSFAHAQSTIKIMFYHRYSWKVLWILLTHGKGKFWRWGELIARYSEAQEGSPVTYTFSRAQIRQLFAAHGFRVVDLSVRHIFPYRIQDYRQGRYVKAWVFREMPPSLFGWLEKRIGWHLLLTAVPDGWKR